MSDIVNNIGTKIKCELTSCFYNSSCCIATCESKKNNRCVCDEVNIKTDELTGDLQCLQWLWGNKPVQCEECQLNMNGEIFIPSNNIEFEIIREDEF